MILQKHINAAVQAALGNGVRIDLKMPDESQTPAVKYDPNPSGYIPAELRGEVVDFDKYKVPFFFVTGVLIGVAFGLRRGKVVVLR